MGGYSFALLTFSFTLRESTGKTGNNKIDADRKQLVWPVFTGCMLALVSHFDRSLSSLLHNLPIHFLVKDVED